MGPHEKVKEIGDIKSVYKVSLKFGSRSRKCNNDWHHLSSLIPGWICCKFHEMVGPSDLSERVCKHKVWGKKMYTEIVCFPTDIFPS